MPVLLRVDRATGDVLELGDVMHRGWTVAQLRDPSSVFVYLPLLGGSQVQFLLGMDYPTTVLGPNRLRKNALDPDRLPPMAVASVEELQSYVTVKPPYDGPNVYGAAPVVIG